jgi:H+/Cl- antiporter ClcA
MSTRKNVTMSTSVIYIIALVVIIVAFLLLGGASWMRGMMHENHSMNTMGWNWTHILISLGIGFLLGILVGRRR